MKRASKEPDVRIVRLPRVTPDGKTGLDDLLALPGGVEIFGALCDAAPKYNAEPKNSERKADIMRGDQVPDESPEWIWNHRLQKRRINSLEGNPGDGKTWVATAIAADLSRGREPFTGRQRATVASIYLSIESDPATTMRRYKANGGNPKLMFPMTGVRHPDGSKSRVTLDDLPVIKDAVQQVRAQVGPHSDVALWIDPMQSVVPSKVDLHRANETREILDPLAVMARELDLTIIVIRHLAKGSGNRAIHRGIGSVDIIASIRSTLLIGSDPDDRMNRALVHVKSNDGPYTESLRFAVEGGENKAHLVWKGISSLTAADLAAPEGGSRKSKEEQASDWLWSFLEDGPRSFKQVMESAPFSGDSESVRRLLNRAASKIRVVMDGPKNDAEKRMWALPDAPKFSANTQRRKDGDERNHL